MPRRTLGVVISEQVMHGPVDIRHASTAWSRVSIAATATANCSLGARLEDAEDIEAWRAEVRRNARADRIKIRTGFNHEIVWVLQVRPDQNGKAEVRPYRDLLLRAVPLAVELRHEPTLAVRNGDELI